MSKPVSLPQRGTTAAPPPSAPTTSKAGNSSKGPKPAGIAPRNTGTTPAIPIASKPQVKDIRAVNNQGKGSLPQKGVAGQGTPEHRLRDRADKIAGNGGYVRASELAKDLFDILNDISRIQLFRDIQGINRNIDSAIDAYWFGNCIRVYADLEAFVVEMVSKWRQTNYDSFKAIGLGQLSAYDKVVKAFGFFDGAVDVSELPQVTTASIFTCARNFMNTLPRGEKIDPREHQDEFNKFLRQQLGRKYLRSERAIGISVDFEPLFHKIKRLQGNKEESEIKLAIQAHLQELRTSLRASAIEQFSGWNDVAAGTVTASQRRLLIAETFLKQDRIDMKESQHFIRSILSAADAHTFDHCIFALYASKAFSAKRVVLSSKKHAAAAVVAAAAAPEFRSAEELSSLLFSVAGSTSSSVDPSLGGDVEAFILKANQRTYLQHLLSGFIALVVMHASEGFCGSRSIADDDVIKVESKKMLKNKNSTLDSISDSIRASLEGAYSADVPKKAVEVMLKVARENILVDNFVAIVDTLTGGKKKSTMRGKAAEEAATAAAAVAADTAADRWQFRYKIVDIIDIINEHRFRQVPSDDGGGGGFSVSKDWAIALLTASVLFHREGNLNLVSKKPHDEAIEAVLATLPALFEEALLSESMAAQQQQKQQQSEKQKEKQTKTSVVQGQRSRVNYGGDEEVDNGDTIIHRPYADDDATAANSSDTGIGTSSPSQQLAADILTCLHHIEKAVNTRLKIPAFDCLALGSFVSYLKSSYPQALKAVVLHLNPSFDTPISIVPDDHHNSADADSAPGLLELLVEVRNNLVDVRDIDNADPIRILSHVEERTTSYFREKGFTQLLAGGAPFLSFLADVVDGNGEGRHETGDHADSLSDEFRMLREAYYEVVVSRFHPQYAVGGGVVVLAGAAATSSSVGVATGANEISSADDTGGDSAFAYREGGGVSLRVAVYAAIQFLIMATTACTSTRSDYADDASRDTGTAAGVSYSQLVEYLRETFDMSSEVISERVCARVVSLLQASGCIVLLHGGGAAAAAASRGSSSSSSAVSASTRIILTCYDSTYRPGTTAPLSYSSSPSTSGLLVFSTSANAAGAAVVSAASSMPSILSLVKEAIAHDVFLTPHGHDRDEFDDSGHRINIDVDVDVNADDADAGVNQIRSRALEALRYVPLGMSCRKSIFWKDLFERRELSLSPAGRRTIGGSLLDFIIENELEIAAARPDIIFAVISGDDDCIPILRDTPSEETFGRVLALIGNKSRKHNYYPIIASWIVAASLGLSSSTSSSSSDTTITSIKRCFRRYFLTVVEGLGSGSSGSGTGSSGATATPLLALLDITMSIASALPDALQHHVVAATLDAMAFACKLDDGNTLQRRVLDMAAAAASVDLDDADGRPNQTETDTRQSTSAAATLSKLLPTLFRISLKCPLQFLPFAEEAKLMGTVTFYDRYPLLLDAAAEVVSDLLNRSLAITPASISSASGSEVVLVGGVMSLTKDMTATASGSVEVAAAAGDCSYASAVAVNSTATATRDGGNEQEVVPVSSSLVSSCKDPASVDDSVDLGRDLKQKNFIRNLLINTFDYQHSDNSGSKDGGGGGDAGLLLLPPKDNAKTTMLKKALDRLSTDLYSEDTHFVMELVQNADDNSYSEGVQPTLKIELYPHAILAYNNEVGFSERNIEAICNVGGSTKEGQKGYIGQKGIGFKSVFKVSDFPELHSNGFHIKFDRNFMIVPIWVNETDSVRWPPKTDDNGNYFETCLRLNLDDKARVNFSAHAQSLQRVFDSNLLLFLNKLERMVLEDKDTDRITEQSRLLISPSWTHITARTVNRRRKKLEATATVAAAATAAAARSLDCYWFIRRRAFDPLCQRKNELARIDSTEIAIAFKFIKSAVATTATATAVAPSSSQRPSSKSTNTASNNIAVAVADQKNDSDVTPTVAGTATGAVDTGSDGADNSDSSVELKVDSSSLLPVYAFLPTKTSLFPFIIQGDFLLNTNREGLLEDSEWNCRLLAEVPALFVEVVLEMVAWALLSDKEAEESCTNIDEITSEFPVSITVRDVLCLLPRLRNCTSRLYRSLVDDIFKRLRDEEFLKSRSGAAHRPRRLVAVHHLHFDPMVFISEESLFKATGLRYLHEDILLDEDLVEPLGIQLFDTNLVIKCIEALEKDAAESYSGTSDTPSSMAMRENYMKSLSGLLLVLDRIAGPSATTSGSGSGGGGGVGHTHPKHQHQQQYKGGPSLIASGGRSVLAVPSQVQLSRLRESSSSSSSESAVLAATARLSAAMINRIKKLRIWPLEDGSVASLESQVILYNSSTGTGSLSGAAPAGGSASSTQANKLTQPQLLCVEKFRSALVLLDAKLFATAGKHCADGDKAIRLLLLRSFKPDILLQQSSQGASGSISGSGSGMASGGLEEISAEGIIKNTILPAYERFKRESNQLSVATHSGNASAQLAAATATNVTEGLLSTTPNVVTSVVVADGSTSGSDNRGSSPPLSRDIAAAFLAFIFLSKSTNDSVVSRLLRGREFVVPVASAKPSQKQKSSYKSSAKSSAPGLVWVPLPQLMTIKRASTTATAVATATAVTTAATSAVTTGTAAASAGSSSNSTDTMEVHLGAEFSSSATIILSALPTALQQLGWLVVDPLVSALVSGNPQTIDRFSRGNEFWSDDVASSVSTVSTGIITAYERFLVDVVGIVNLFGVSYSYPSSSLSGAAVVYFTGSADPPSSSVSPRWQAPSLLQLLRHLTRNGQVIQPSNNNNHSEGAESSETAIIGTGSSTAGGRVVKGQVSVGGGTVDSDDRDDGRKPLALPLYLPAAVVAPAAAILTPSGVATAKKETTITTLYNHALASSAYQDDDGDGHQEVTSSSNCSTVLAISREVHATLSRLVPVISRELQNWQQSQKDPTILGNKQQGSSNSSSSSSTSSSILEDLRSLPWFPAILHKEVLVFQESLFGDDLKTIDTRCRDANGDLCVVTSPRNVFMKIQNDTSFSNNYSNFSSMAASSEPLGYHCLYAARDLERSLSASSIRDLAVFFDAKQLQLSYTGDLQEDANQLPLLIGLLRWMSREKLCLSTIAFMTNVYQKLYTFMTRCSNEWTTQVKDMLAGDAPFLWTPSALGARVDETVAGEMIPLSRAIKIPEVPAPAGWKSGGSSGNGSGLALPHPSKFYFDDCRSKVILFYYEGLDALFARTRYCSACQAAEGMYGLQGAPSLGEKRGSSMGRQRCACVDRSFGSFVPCCAGLVRNSPSVRDMIDLLRIKCRAAIAVSTVSTTSTSRSSSSSASSSLMNPSARQRELQEEVKEILESLSREIWKCFNIPQCLHPYSPSSLRHLREVLQAEELLPALDAKGKALFLSSAGGGLVADTKTASSSSSSAYSSSASASATLSARRSRRAIMQKLIAVDDSSLFLEFEEDLRELCSSHRSSSRLTARTADSTDAHSDDDDDDYLDDDDDDSDAARKINIRLIDGLPKSSLLPGTGTATVTAAAAGGGIGIGIDADALLFDDDNDNTEGSRDTDAQQENQKQTATYDIESFEADVGAFINLPENEFYDAAGTIPEKTFFAPKNCSALLKYLQVPLLSDYVKVDWILGEYERCRDTTGFVGLMNALLLGVQTYLYFHAECYAHLLERLTVSATRLHRLLRLQVYGCDDIQRKLSLRITFDDVPGFAVESERIHDADFHHDPRSNLLLLSPSISHERKVALCIKHFIMPIIRVEVARVEKNQRVDLMEGIEKLLGKLAARGDPFQCLEYEFGGRLLPEEKPRWQLVPPTILTYEPAAAEEEEKEEGEEHDTNDGSAFVVDEDARAGLAALIAKNDKPRPVSKKPKKKELQNSTDNDMLAAGFGAQFGTTGPGRTATDTVSGDRRSTSTSTGGEGGSLPPSDNHSNQQQKDASSIGATAAAASEDPNAGATATAGDESEGDHHHRQKKEEGSEETLSVSAVSVTSMVDQEQQSRALPVPQETDPEYAEYLIKKQKKKESLLLLEQQQQQEGELDPLVGASLATDAASAGVDVDSNNYYNNADIDYRGRGEGSGDHGHGSGDNHHYTGSTSSSSSTYADGDRSHHDHHSAAAFPPGSERSGTHSSSGGSSGGGSASSGTEFVPGTGGKLTFSGTFNESLLKQHREDASRSSSSYVQKMSSLPMGGASQLEALVADELTILLDLTTAAAAAKNLDQQQEEVADEESASAILDETAAAPSVDTESSVSGRIGEKIVANYLRSILITGDKSGDKSGEKIGDKSGDKSGDKEGGGGKYPGGVDAVVEVVWVNEDGEKGEPYDILVKYHSGKTKQCEVKTRTRRPCSNGNDDSDDDHDDQLLNATTVAGDAAAAVSNGKGGRGGGGGGGKKKRRRMGVINQWFISLKEIEQARREGVNYFCALVCIEFDSTTNCISTGNSGSSSQHGQDRDDHQDKEEVAVSSHSNKACRIKLCESYIVGLESGLCEAIVGARKEASLVLQVNDKSKNNSNTNY